MVSLGCVYAPMSRFSSTVICWKMRLPLGHVHKAVLDDLLGAHMHEVLAHEGDGAGARAQKAGERL